MIESIHLMIMIMGSEDMRLVNKNKSKIGILDIYVIMMLVPVEVMCNKFE